MSAVETIGDMGLRVADHVRADPRGSALRACVAVLLVATVHNAAFSQDAPHAAPWFGGAEPAVEVAALEPAAPKRARAIPDPVVFGLQSELMDLGFYEGGIDGIVGSRTRSAIEAYERAQGLPATGKATEALLNRIRVADVRHLPRPDALPRPSTSPERRVSVARPTVSPEATGSVAPAPELPVREVQEALRATGVAIEADGLMGPNTRAAIEAWEEARGLPILGEPTVELLRRMRGTGAPAR